MWQTDRKTERQTVRHTQKNRQTDIGRRGVARNTSEITTTSLSRTPRAGLWSRMDMPSRTSTTRRQADRQTDRQTAIQADIQKDRQSYRQAYRHSNTQADSQA